MEQLPIADNYEQRRLQEALRFDINAEKLRGIDIALGPEGIGTFVLRQVLDADQIELMQAEIFDPHCVTWRDNHDRFTNKRGIEVIENHTVFALKLHQGDPELVARVPHMRALATNIEKLTRNMASIFPDLYGWTADEMSLHRYDDPEIGLSFHKDNLRFDGLISVLTLEGESDFLVKDDSGEVHTYEVTEGDLVMTRATGLYPATDARGRKINLCPDHAVVNLRTPHRTSFIVRANTRPDEPVPGFSYDNWSVQEESAA